MDLSQPDITLHGLKYRVTLSIVVQKKAYFSRNVDVRVF